MDTFAAVGSLVITEGASAPFVLTTQPGQAAVGPEYPPASPAERHSADAVFSTHQREDADYSMPATLLVVSASVATLKSIAIDEGKRSQEQDEDEKTLRLKLPRGQDQKE